MSTSTSFIGRGMAWLAGAQQAYDSVAGVYTRGIERIDVRVVLGTKLLKISDGAGGFRLAWTDMDISIPCASLELSGRTVEPRKGDGFELEQAGETVRFEVLPLPGEAGWRDDPHHTQWRVHLKRVS